jgi:hypothetical protein
MNIVDVLSHPKPEIVRNLRNIGKERKPKKKNSKSGEREGLLRGALINFTQDPLPWALLFRLRSRLHCSFGKNIIILITIIIITTK